MIAFRFSSLLMLVMVLSLLTLGTVDAQGTGFRGEASLSGILSEATVSDLQLRIRYLPEVSTGLALSPSVQLDFSLSANLWLSRTSSGEDGTAREESVDPYRAWARVSAPRFEVRAGLQKISFGSATIFRPLMWFDKIDPRDPLQLSEGVWGLLGRVYFPRNLSAWGWVLAAEEDRKGWEVFRSLEGTAEAGGRIQLPLGPGEIAATYHHRRFEISTPDPFSQGLPSPTGSEDRLAVDGKWDLEVGLWIEGAFIRQDSEALTDRWTHALSVGVDYTFSVGNGLTVLAEHIRKTNPTLQDDAAVLGTKGSGAVSLDEDQVATPPSRLRLTSFTASYPHGILDRIALAIYRDWENSMWYRLLEWRRTYDRWRFHLQGFWNPSESLFFFFDPGENTTSSGSLGGRGVQLIVAFNH